MATITPAITYLEGPEDYDGCIVTWANITNADSCSAVGQADRIVGFADRSVQVTGTFGGTTCSIQGSNDGTNFYSLHNPLGTALDITTAGLSAILEATRSIKPLLAGGSGSTLTVTLLARKLHR